MISSQLGYNVPKTWQGSARRSVGWLSARMRAIYFQVCILPSWCNSIWAPLQTTTVELYDCREHTGKEMDWWPWRKVCCLVAWCNCTSVHFFSCAPGPGGTVGRQKVQGILPCLLPSPTSPAWTGLLSGPVLNVDLVMDLVRTHCALQHAVNLADTHISFYNSAA